MPKKEVFTPEHKKKAEEALAVINKLTKGQRLVEESLKELDHEHAMALRMMLGLSQTKLAAAFNVTRSWVSKIESGSHQIPAEYMTNLQSMVIAAIARGVQARVVKPEKD